MSCNCGASIGHPLVPKCICKQKKVRELTDEEIDEVWAETCSDFKLIENGKTKGIINIYDVSRAILKKASEK
jgi:carbonic anhydrase